MPAANRVDGLTACKATITNKGQDEKEDVANDAMQKLQKTILEIIPLLNGYSQKRIDLILDAVKERIKANCSVNCL